MVMLVPTETYRMVMLILTETYRMVMVVPTETYRMVMVIPTQAYQTVIASNGLPAFPLMGEVKSHVKGQVLCRVRFEFHLLKMRDSI
jgi:hypothetical protein